MTDFYQEAPRLGNQFSGDSTLASWLQWKLPSEMYTEVEPDLIRFGERVVTDIHEAAVAAEAHEPVHVPYEPWGRRIDEIQVSDAWRALDRISAEEGLVAEAYEREYGEFSRLAQMARIYMFAPSSALYTCPLAMTDGAACLLETYGDDLLKTRALLRLTSRDPSYFWTSGQWMTERTGGSDVGNTITVAKADGDAFRLYGEKWFTSAITAQMAMTLARPEGAPAGSRGLSLFYVELEDEKGRLNNLEILRLKEKLGTRALPTAELSLNGTLARQVGGPGNGVKKISTLFNITRIYNSVCALGAMRRGLALARAYAEQREVFGRLLCEQPLHISTMAELQVELEAAFHLTFHLISLLGKVEAGRASADESTLLRALTPITKLYTAKQAMSVVSEVLETFGGMGYVETTGLPTLLRDAQVLPIWEGTTNVLALDMLRAMAKENALEPLMADLNRRLQSIKHASLQDSVARVRSALEQLNVFLVRANGEGREFLEAGARHLSFAIARTYTAGLLLQRADRCLVHEADKGPALAAIRWCQKDLAPVILPDADFREGSRNLATSAPGEQA